MIRPVSAHDSEVIKLSLFPPAIGSITRLAASVAKEMRALVLVGRLQWAVFRRAAMMILPRERSSRDEYRFPIQST